MAFVRQGLARISSVADPEGGFRGVFCACQYMKIPTDLDPKPPLRRILAQNPP